MATMRRPVLTVCKAGTFPAGTLEVSTHQSADLLLSVWCWSRGGFDHGGRLIICQFLDAPLPCYNIAHLREQQATSEQRRLSMVL